MKPCLKCGKSFKAQGPFNRICTTCAKKNEKVDPLPRLYPTSGFQIVGDSVLFLMRKTQSAI